jgi:hypothetical protein
MMHRVSTGSPMTRSSTYYFSIFRQRGYSSPLADLQRAIQIKRVEPR